jgi:hypothetical protein
LDECNQLEQDVQDNNCVEEFEDRDEDEPLVNFDNHKQPKSNMGVMKTCKNAKKGKLLTKKNLSKTIENS